jgi:hypothetical protein
VFVPFGEMNVHAHSVRQHRRRQIGGRQKERRQTEAKAGQEFHGLLMTHRGGLFKWKNS